QAPFRGRLPPGPHVVVARLDGYAESRKTIVVETTGEQRFEIGLTATAALTVDQRPHPALKWVAAGGAAAALVTGVVLLAMDGRGTCDADGDACQEVYDTRTAGLAGVALRRAAGGAAGWLVARDRGPRRGRDARTQTARGSGYTARAMYTRPAASPALLLTAALAAALAAGCGDNLGGPSA